MYLGKMLKGKGLIALRISFIYIDEQFLISASLEGLYEKTHPTPPAALPDVL